MKKLCSVLLVLLLAAALFSAPALAEDTEFVYDRAEILSDAEVGALTEAAASISHDHSVGVYIVTLSDMEDYGFHDIEACAEAFFNDMELGLGSDRTGVMLILSMAGRDYDIDAHGDFAHYAFTDYGKTTVSDAFLDNFRRDDWYGGFADYLSRCEELLVLAERGEPVDITVTERVSAGLTPAGLICCAVLSALLAWFVCGLLKGKMQTAKLASEADSYVLGGAAQITQRQDRFTHATQTRRKIERNDSRSGGGGGTSVSSGGHSHSSGKF